MSLVNNLISPLDIRLGIADRLKRIRLDQNVSQEQLVERSGVSLGSLRRFESKGEISLKSLVRLAISLNRAQDFDLLFQIEEEIDLFKQRIQAQTKSEQGYKMRENVFLNLEGNRQLTAPNGVKEI